MRSSSKFSSFFFCLIQTYFLCTEFVTGCLVDERRALLQFRNGLHDPETRLSSWRGKECCSWRGIKCDNQTGSITSINLANPYPNTDRLQLQGFWNLSGEIDSSLLQLKSLEQLDLSYNTFDGIPIPSFFGSMKKLRYLNLSNTGFSGTVPAQLRNLTRLQYLDLDLSYSIYPLIINDFEWISGLFSLNVLSMNFVNLSMAESGLFRALNRLSSLKELHMSCCGIKTIVQNIPLINLTSLQVVDLSHNNFNTMIPSWFANLSSLVYLDLSSAKFSGMIPEMSRISSLRFIDLSFNDNLTADIFELLGGNWKQVENIQLAGNRVEGFLPDSIGNFTSLIELNLNNNNIKGGIPSSIGKVCNLESLSLDSNNLTFSLPRSLEVQGCLSDKPLQKLNYFSMRDNEIEGILPEWLGELRNLAIMYLDNNKITGSIPLSLGNINCLIYNNCSETYYDKSISIDVNNGLIHTVMSKTSIDLSGNNLSGEFPLTLTNLSGLIILNLSENNLIGKIPQNIHKMKEIETLDLSNNEFFGKIPTTISSLTFLSNLNLSNNNFSGMIPEGGQMTTFDSSAFSGNRFLCGQPLTVVCKEDNVNQNSKYDQNNGDDMNKESVDDWFYLVFGLGFAVGLLGLVSVMFIRKQWADTYFHFVDWLVKRAMNEKRIVPRQ